MSDLSADVMLWLPAHLTENRDLVGDVTKANGLIMDFCDRDIELEQLLEEFLTLGFSPDDFRNVLDANLRQRGA